MHQIIASALAPLPSDHRTPPPVSWEKIGPALQAFCDAGSADGRHSDDVAERGHSAGFAADGIEDGGGW